MTKKESITWKRALVFLALLFIGLPLGADAQNVPSNWKKFDGKLFSFFCPPTWKVSQVDDSYVRLQAPESPVLTMEIEHTTDYGSNLDNILAAEKTTLQKLASTLGLNVTVDSPEPDRRGGTSISAAFDNGFGIVSDAWVNGVAIGKSIYIMRMSTLQSQSAQNISHYRMPLVDSIAFHLPATSIAGTWSSAVHQDSYGSAPSTARQFEVSITLSADGHYAYSARQTLAPSWELWIAGNWAVTDPMPFNSANSVQVRLTPADIQFLPASTAATDRTYELARLSYEGYPLTTVESFAAYTGRTGGLDLKKLSNNTPVHFVLSAPATPALQITDAAAFSSGPIAPGSLMALFGSFGVPQAAANGRPLPTSLSNVGVTVAGRPAPLLYVSSSQVNAQVPFETPEGIAQVTMSIRGGMTLTGSITVARSSPRLFAYQTTHAVAANENYTLNGSSNPAKAGSYLIVYITGQGAFRTPLASGAAAPSSPLALTSATTTASIGGKPATVAFSGGAPGFAGVAQVNVQVPGGLAKGDLPLIITVGGIASNSLNVSVTP